MDPIDEGYIANEQAEIMSAWHNDEVWAGVRIKKGVKYYIGKD
jgi:hypothetical protein